MEQYNRINWHKGMDVSPEIFVDADNYHIYQQNIRSGIQTLRTYGVLPGREEQMNEFHVVHRFDGYALHIEEIVCHAITQQGYVIAVNNNPQCLKELNLGECELTPYYVLLSVNPYRPKQILSDKTDDYAQSTYVFRLQKASLRKPYDDGIPILKIAHSGSKWVAVGNYVPPCMALCSAKLLEDRFDEIRSKLIRISQMLEKNRFPFQFALLALELKNFTGFETPFDLFMHLKKFILVFSLCSENELRGVKNFLDLEYNPNEIIEMLKGGINCLDVIIAVLTPKETVEAPKPKPEAPKTKPDIVEFEIKI